MRQTQRGLLSHSSSRWSFSQVLQDSPPPYVMLVYKAVLASMQFCTRFASDLLSGWTCCSKATWISCFPFFLLSNWFLYGSHPPAERRHLPDKLTSQIFGLALSL